MNFYFKKTFQLLITVFIILRFSTVYAASELIDSKITSDWTLQYDVTNLKSLTINGGTVDLNGHTMIINDKLDLELGKLKINNGNLIIKGDLNMLNNYSEITINNGSITVEKNLNLNGGHLDLDTGKISIYGDLLESGKGFDEFPMFLVNNGKAYIHGNYYINGYAFFKMEKKDGYVLVEKDFVINSNRSGYSDSGATSDENHHLKAGTLEIKGNFLQKKQEYNIINFSPVLDHKVILSGGSTQTITFESEHYSKFNILQVNKPIYSGYNFTNVHWNELIEAVDSDTDKDDNSDPNWKIWETKNNVSKTKTWEVEFTNSIDISTIKEKNIYVTDSKGTIIPMFYYCTQSNGNIISIIPIKEYTSGETYTLWIKNIKSSDGTILRKYIKMDFSIE